MVKTLTEAVAHFRRLAEVDPTESNARLLALAEEVLTYELRERSRARLTLVRP